jgi:hypothetical protein
MTLPNLHALLAVLSEAGVEYVVIGGVAVAVHGHIRATEDLDIVPNPDSENLDRLCRVLENEEAMLLLKPSRRFGAREGWALRRGSNISLTTRHGDVDVVGRLAGVPDYSTLLEDAERYDVGGITLVVASRARIMQMKQVRDSAQDRADIEALRMLDAEDDR